MTMTITYTIYLTISAAVTIWVAQTLHRRGKVFLLDTFRNDEAVANAVNDLLVVGFYLINFGYVTLALKYGDKPTTPEGHVEYLATKIGLVMLLLGIMHFFNLAAFAKWRAWHECHRVPRPMGESPFAPLDAARLREAIRNSHN